MRHTHYNCADVPKKCMKPHEECKDKYKGPVCNCEHGYKRKHGHCVGKKITDKHTHTFI
jgi:hypothetical protein